MSFKMPSETSSLSQDDLIDDTDFSKFLSSEMSFDASFFWSDVLDEGLLISFSLFFLSGDFLLHVPFTWHNEHLSS